MRDAHDGLQMHTTKYTGLSYVTPSGKDVYAEYNIFFEELTRFSQVVYSYSDCVVRFDMEKRLDIESRTLAQFARTYGFDCLRYVKSLGEHETILFGHGK